MDVEAEREERKGRQDEPDVERERPARADSPDDGRERDERGQDHRRNPLAEARAESVESGASEVFDEPMVERVQVHRGIHAQEAGGDEDGRAPAVRRRPRRTVENALEGERQRDAAGDPEQAARGRARQKEKERDPREAGVSGVAPAPRGERPEGERGEDEDRQAVFGLAPSASSRGAGRGRPEKRRFPRGRSRRRRRERRGAARSPALPQR